MYPEIPLPPKPILTRWGTWLEAVEYYAEHIDSINNVLLALDSEDAVSIDTAKTVTCDISVKNDLAHIQHTFSCIIKTLKSLQNRHLSLSESFEIINSTVEQLNRGRGKVADAVRAKVDTVLSKTLDMKNYKRNSFGEKQSQSAGTAPRVTNYKNGKLSMDYLPQKATRSTSAESSPTFSLNGLSENTQKNINQFFDSTPEEIQLPRVEIVKSILKNFFVIKGEFSEIVGQRSEKMEDQENRVDVE
ncbi:hypothetical protein ANN_00357 [Periplaneta americana]|uniref:Uncharacterized protein n=1 Tax=Periplaneta americana TaxID=6978 RepID=A0ABQ8TUL7_PERAM|nr:hypothetical protein ANN_00357 [Periplaneta americana]